MPTRRIVRRQAEVDIVSDGEMSKISYATYIAKRLSGFSGDTPREPGQDLVEFPGLLKKLAERGSTAKYRRPRCTGEVRLEDSAPLRADLQNMQAAIRASSPADAFLNAASPGVIALFQPNDYYPTQDDYLTALAEALRSEYEAIVGAIYGAAVAGMQGGGVEKLPELVPQLLYIAVLPYLGAEAAEEELRRGPDDLVLYRRGDL